MSKTDQEKIELELEIRLTQGKAQAFFDGELDENGREVWVWLPLSQIEIENNGNAKGKLVTVLMPEWLAIDKGIV